MSDRIRPKLTFANVMVVILTFIVLGGGAYAASQLPRNSVGTKQLKNGAVTQRKISAAARAALRGKEGPRGPKGTQGPKGTRGPEGPRGPKGDAAVPGETIPVGTTLRGVASSTAVSPTPGSSSSGTGVSFGGFQLPTRPLVNIVPIGGAASTACPGTAAAPAAASGNLCIYLTETTPASTGQLIVLDPSAAGLSGVNFNLSTNAPSALGDGTVAQFGFQIAFAQPSANGAQLRSTWAVTG